MSISQFDWNYVKKSDLSAGRTWVNDVEFRNNFAAQHREVLCVYVWIVF